MTRPTEDQLRAVAEQAEETKDEPMPAGSAWAFPGHARSKVLQVRLNPEEYEELARYAQQCELPVSTVARAAILAQLRDDGEPSLPVAIEHLAADVEQLRRFVSRPRREAG
ncbi:MAG: hypothetical protein ACRDQA_32160 [Nocardioidaceae bacterium]